MSKHYMDNKYIQYTYSIARSILAYKSDETIKHIWLEAKQNIDKLRLSYSIFQNVEKEPVCFTNAETNAQGFSYVQDRTLYITFRGTQEQHDILIDIDIFLESILPNMDNRILIHKGFLTQFQSLQSAIEAEITHYRDSIDAIHFCGHSLGAALATIASAYYGYLYKDDRRKIVCYTFGCPRVGNTHFMNMFQTYVSENARVRNEKDPVPIIPLSGRFTHISESITVNDAQEISHVPEIAWYWRIFYLPFEIDYTAPIKHHSCFLYLERMIYFAKFGVERTYTDLL